eukprot:jgi/Ulvmu1/8714/UM047_0054.1
MGKRGYAEAPWIFKGNALYQLNLVRTEEARKHIPEDFRVVDFFGWTLGGVYLARYSDSPVGAFDELVVLAGLVWNPPTSCAWAQRVYVNNRAARNHGLRHVGLPSRVASFTQQEPPVATAAATPSWWNVGFAPHSGGSTAEAVEVWNMERGRRGMRGAPVGELLLPRAVARRGPRIRMQLPNFSGGTAEHPGLLHYTCEMRACVRPTGHMAVQRPLLGAAVGVDVGEDPHPEDVSTVLRGRPLMCIAFDDMEMSVPEPQPLMTGRGGRPVMV